MTDISASLRIRVIGGQAIEQHAERAGSSPVAVAREGVSNGFRGRPLCSVFACCLNPVRAWGAAGLFFPAPRRSD